MTINSFNPNNFSAVSFQPILISDYGMLKEVIAYILSQGTKNPYTQLHSLQTERYRIESSQIDLVNYLEE